MHIGEQPFSTRERMAVLDPQQTIGRAESGRSTDERLRSSRKSALRSRLRLFPGPDTAAHRASVESPRIYRAVDVSNQNGDIDAFNRGNSKASKDV